MNAPRNPCALNSVLVHRGVPLRVWFNNPAPRNGVWLVRPSGDMFWASNNDVVAMSFASDALAANAFPPADPVAPLPLAA